MAAAVVTSNGQITIPKDVRDRLGVDSGDRVEFVELEKGVFTVVAATPRVRTEHTEFTEKSSFARRTRSTRRNH